MRSSAFSPIAFALATIILAPQVAAQTQDGREEGPIGIEKCRTSDKPGSYKLVNNLTLSTTPGTCLLITADFVTLDLAGFTITGPGIGSPPEFLVSAAIAAPGNFQPEIAASERVLVQPDQV